MTLQADMVHLLKSLALRALVPVVTIQGALFSLWMRYEFWMQFGGVPQQWFTRWLYLNLPLYQILITGVVIPVFMSIIGIWLTCKASGIETFLALVFLVFCLLVDVFLAYASWGITTGRFWHPDGETVGIESGAAVVGLMIMSVSFLGAAAIRCAPRLYRKSMVWRERWIASLRSQ